MSATPTGVCSTRSRRRTMLAATVAGFGLALAGCTTDDNATPQAGESPTAPEPPANGLPDPCSLLTADEIAAAAGGSFKEGEFDTTLSNDFQSICTWYSADGFTPFVQVLVTRRGDAIDSQRSSAEEVFDIEDATVAGGQSAYITSDGTILGMAVGTFFVQVSFIPDGNLDVHDITIPLAEDVAAAF